MGRKIRGRATEKKGVRKNEIISQKGATLKKNAIWCHCKKYVPVQIQKAIIICLKDKD